ncbi:LOW QUALITY PROTEIN: hypothetical protein CRUP_025634, partial [Coryphaenoides rupestris]
MEGQQARGTGEVQQGAGSSTDEAQQGPGPGPVQTRSSKVQGSGSVQMRSSRVRVLGSVRVPTSGGHTEPPLTPPPEGRGDAAAVSGGSEGRRLADDHHATGRLPGGGGGRGGVEERGCGLLALLTQAVVAWRRGGERRGGGGGVSPLSSSESDRRLRGHPAGRSGGLRGAEAETHLVLQQADVVLQVLWGQQQQREIEAQRVSTDASRWDNVLLVDSGLLRSFLTFFSASSCSFSFSFSLRPASISCSSTLCISTLTSCRRSASFCRRGGAGGEEKGQQARLPHVETLGQRFAFKARARCWCSQQYLGGVLQVLLLLAPASAGLPEGQAGVGQLQGELGGLQAGLVHLRLPAVALRLQDTQVSLQVVHAALAGGQTLAQAAHLPQRCLALRLSRTTAGERDGDTADTSPPLRRVSQIFCHSIFCLTSLRWAEVNLWVRVLMVFCSCRMLVSLWARELLRLWNSFASDRSSASADCAPLQLPTLRLPGLAGAPVSLLPPPRLPGLRLLHLQQLRSLQLTFLQAACGSEPTCSSSARGTTSSMSEAPSASGPASSSRVTRSSGGRGPLKVNAGLRWHTSPVPATYTNWYCCSELGPG